MGKVVMVVDDSEFTRNFVKRLILEAGDDIEVVEACDGREAIDKFEEFRPDLVFMDLMMPNVDGIDALKKIMAGNIETKVVVYTGSDHSQKIKEALEYGALDIIPKPITKEDIFTLITKYLK